MKFFWLMIICLAFVSAAAQEGVEREKAEALDCAFHRKGPWIDSSLRPEGKVRFTYLLEPATDENPRTLYVAFWNATQTEGRLLEFHLSKTREHKDAVAIANEGSIWDNKGQPDIRDLQGGLYVYQHVKNQLPKLKEQQATVLAIDQMRKTSAVCSSPLDYFGGENRGKTGKTGDRRDVHLFSLRASSAKAREKPGDRRDVPLDFFPIWKSSATFQTTVVGGRDHVC